MGLDITLGVMILLGAVRGWFRGFVLQSIRLASLVGSAYAAAPIRDRARPYVAPYLTSIRADLLDRMLWWSSALVSYIAMAGLASLAVKLYRRRPYGEPEPNRGDQLAGFLLASVKGAVVAAFLVGALDRHALSWVKGFPWAVDQARTSQALVWNEQYSPADRIWSAAPVQAFVAHVRKMGVDGPSPTEGTPVTGPSPVRTASRPPRLDLPIHLGLDPQDPDFADQLDRALRLLDGPKPGDPR